MAFVPVPGQNGWFRFHAGKVHCGFPSCTRMVKGCHHASRQAKKSLKVIVVWILSISAVKKALKFNIHLFHFSTIATILGSHIRKKGGPGIFQASMRRQSQRQLLWKSAVDSEILCDLAVCFFLSLIQVNMISVIFFLVSLFTTGALNCELPDEHPGPWPNSTMTHNDLRADSRDQSASQSPQRQDGRCKEVQVVPETNSKFAPEIWRLEYVGIPICLLGWPIFRCELLVSGRVAAERPEHLQ